MTKPKNNPPEDMMDRKKAAIEAERRIEEAMKRGKAGARSAEIKTLIGISLDISGSMYASGAVAEAQKGLDDLLKGVEAEELLKLTVELHISVFAGSAKTVRKFGPVNGCSAKSVFAELPQVDGGTNIANAAQHIMDEVDQHQKLLREEGQNIRYTAVFLITDGYDDQSEALKAAGQRIKSAESKGSFRFIPIGVENADHKQLALLAPEPLRLAGITDFSNFFRWLIPFSRGLSQSQIGEKIPMPDLVKSSKNPDGWAERYGSIG